MTRDTTPYAALGRRIVVIALIVTAAVALPRGAQAQEPVSYWSGIAKTVIIDMANRGGSPSAVDFAYVHAAIYDAVNAIDKRHTVFAVSPTTFPDGASEPAAVAAAAATILKALFTASAQQAFVDAQYTAFVGLIPAGEAKNRGIAVGTEIAKAFLAQRNPGPRQDLGQDGRNATCATDVRLCYTFGAGPGVYQLTPGASSDPNVTPAAQWVGILKPFGVVSQSRFRADGPPNLTSAQWADDYNEVKLFGAATGSARTQEQTDIGWFYTDNPGAYGNRIIRQIAADQNLALADSARFFAQTYVTMADTFVNCWDSKRYYNFWRPVTAIRAGDTDDNDATEPDPSWLPLALTPNHQDIPRARLFHRSRDQHGRKFLRDEKNHAPFHRVFGARPSMYRHGRWSHPHVPAHARRPQGNHRRANLRRHALSHVRSSRDRHEQQSRSLDFKALLLAS